MNKYETRDPKDVRGTNGSKRFKSLFGDIKDNFENLRTSEPPAPITTLEEAHKVYIDIGDISEYRFALWLTGDIEHWEELSLRPWFMKHLALWRRELALKVQSEALYSIQEQSIGSKGFAAAKWLAERGWTQTRGRPSKKAIEDEAKKLQRQFDELDEDIARMESLVN